MANAKFSVIAGFFAGMAEVLIGHPFDTIKTRLQTQGATDRVGEKAMYRGPMHCAVVIIRREGLAGLYRGILSPLIQDALGVALLFGAMDWLREAMGASIFTPHLFVLACVMIGLVESLIYCPFDHIKARLQVGAAKSRRKATGGGGGTGILLGGGLGVAEVQLASTMQAMLEITKARGPLGLYYGWIFQLLKETTGNVALFATYDCVMLLLGEGGSGRGGSRHAHPEGLHWLHVWPAGSLAGMAYYAVSYPFDALKSRVQTDSLTLPQFRGSFHAVVACLEEKNGWRELYRGLSACLLRAIPGSAVQFIVFEVVFGFLQTIVTVHKTLKPHMAGMEHFAHMEHLI